MKLESASVGQKWLVIGERSRAQQTIVVHHLPADGDMPSELGEGQKMEFDEPAYTLSGGELTWILALYGPLAFPL